MARVDGQYSWRLMCGATPGPDRHWLAGHKAVRNSYAQFRPHDSRLKLGSSNHIQTEIFKSDPPGPQLTTEAVVWRNQKV